MVVHDSPESQLLDRVRAGDQSATAALLQHHEPRLKLMVRMRMHPRLRQRVDEDDVLQDAYVEAVSTLPAFLDQADLPFFLWLRQIVKRRIQKSHREHLGFQLRDARREVALREAAGASSAYLAEQLIGRLTTPSCAAIRKEKCQLLAEAIDHLNELDREILSLRNFEQLSNLEAARELGIEPAAASKRYLRALLRLETVLAEVGLNAEQIHSSGT